MIYSKVDVSNKKANIRLLFVFLLFFLLLINEKRVIKQ